MRNCISRVETHCPKTCVSRSCVRPKEVQSRPDTGTAGVAIMGLQWRGWRPVASLPALMKFPVPKAVSPSCLSQASRPALGHRPAEIWGTRGVNQLQLCWLQMFFDPLEHWLPPKTILTRWMPAMARISSTIKAVILEPHSLMSPCLGLVQGVHYFLVWKLPSHWNGLKNVYP